MSEKPPLVEPLKSSLMANLADQLVTSTVSILPHAPGANGLKLQFMAWRGATVGKRIKLWSGIWIDTFRRLTLGDDVTVGKDVMLVSAGGVRIGDRAMIGHGSKIISAGHLIPPDRRPMRTSGLELRQVTIEDDVWIAAQAVVLPGITVGTGAVVAAGAVVTKDVSPYHVVAGVPARFVRERD